MATVFLIPAPLEDESLEAIPAYVLDAIKQCTVLFAENERTARRYLKKLDKAIVIDEYEWYTIHKAEQEVKQAFINQIKAGKNIGIISEAGCPGIADPGQVLIEAAHQHGATIKPLAGPSSILLALMGSGMNGQQFAFVGYLPIDEQQRKKKLLQLEEYSAKQQSTQVFIETPYRNNQLLETILKTCKPTTRICVAANLTAANESIVTKTVADWKKEKPELHKQPVIFCLMG
ncbi:16S rRNA (cytidine1402-2'-O)-methyltransferase [Lacibacter cauensis]|uniref:16S rRNA (Cytidine1402-2'-O)-methyltransferase n=1 Tax=Lacibacter cauensis TaxID=510947 RepID=A0A562SIY2_9BACT|nr:SAM-dependent methyltransferase [Lacibacter cauensis]TWI81235.1 16S rRNA (cytidine1402-2'-O)-methyltransferase [Lacibacter cauensis]